MTVPPDQKSLLADLSAKIDRLPDQETLATFMGQVLRSLLRRRGDAEFLGAVQDAFIAGMADRDWAGQQQLAREVVRVVIEIRPEIAAAWQAMNSGAAAAPLRRASDLAQSAAPPGAASPGAPRSPAPPEAERLVSAFDDLESAVHRLLSNLTTLPAGFTGSKLGAVRRMVSATKLCAKCP